MIVGISAGQQECQDVKGGTLCQIPVWTKLPPAGRQPWGISMVHDVAVITKVTVSKRRGGTHAAVQVQLCAGHRLIATESFDLANCDTVELAQDAAAVFVVGWANDLRNAAQQQVGSVIKDVEITADGKGPGAAEVKLSIRLPSYNSNSPPKTHTPALEIRSVSSIAAAEEAAKRTLHDILSKASNQCEPQARAAFHGVRNFLSAFGRLPDWLTRAKEVMRLP